MDKVSFIVQTEERGERLDSYLSVQLPELSRSRLQELITKAFVLVNGCPVSKSYKLRGEELIEVAIPEAAPLDVLPENIPLQIVYEDSELLVVNKPQGMVVHPAPGSTNGTLVNALLYHCGDSLSGINGVQRPGIVHRIDRNTSGLLIVAKTDAAHRGLAAQIAVHSFSRAYLGICYGAFSDEAGTVNKPVGRSRTDRKKMAVDPEGKTAVTHYRVLKEFHWREGTFSYVKFVLETGRTHQIRVHTSSLGHPLVGDDVYGGERLNDRLFPELCGQCLHAYHIGFVHPVSGTYLEFEVNPPDSFRNVLLKISDGFYQGD